ncbi:MAG: FAD-dependent thymidylate synthase [Eubacteriales bacterium]|nr:FAD-dependent thymidylate synthase [Eubacteriales bacterium]
MKVTLLSHTPDPERLVAAAARLCYSNKTVDTLYEGMSHPEDMVKMLIDMGHESPLEHASFTFGVEGVSRALLAQLTRHRIASFSVKSQRYVDEAKLQVVTPPAIAENSEAKAMFDETTEYLRKKYIALRDILKQGYISEGMDEKSAQKKALEDARFVLPNACETSLIMTMNVRSLFNFFSLRCCNRAQWEIRDLADEMLRLVKEVAPSIFENAGAPCVSGPCDQGKMTCGKPRR